MAKTDTKTTNPLNEIRDLKLKIQDIRMSIKAGIEKNTNAHKAARRELAQKLTKLNK